MNSDQVKHMVDRFLGWRLPERFNPDNGISFDPIANKGHEFESKREPVGTNLFDADQATAMVNYMVEGLPSAPESSPIQMDEAAVDAVMRDWGTIRDMIDSLEGKTLCTASGPDSFIDEGYIDTEDYDGPMKRIQAAILRLIPDEKWSVESVQTDFGWLDRVSWAYEKNRQMYHSRVNALANAIALNPIRRLTTVPQQDEAGLLEILAQVFEAQDDAWDDDGATKRLYALNIRRGLSAPITPALALTFAHRLLTVHEEMIRALQLAELWLANSVPVGTIDGPKPLPVIRAALKAALPQPPQDITDRRA